MYQALYRKWRPQTFDQVIGQKHITETLKNQVRTGRLSHAYIFIGTRGTGKTTCARILARAVNCEHPVDGNPCGECAACRGIMDGSVLDVVELDAASNNGVDNVRALRDEAVFSPASVRKRVYIIDEVHMLSTPAFNALLKILEEPPEHLMFILATTELQKVPATILSRCQRHSFKRIDSATLADHLQYVARQEHFDMTRDAAELIARLADGGVRDALSLLDQCSAADRIDTEAVYSAMGLAGNRRVAQLLDGILAHDMAGVLKLFNGMWMDGKDPASLLTELSALLRDILMIHAAPKAALELISGGYDAAALRDFAARMTTEELLSAMSTLQTHMAALKNVKNPKTAAELCLVSLCDDTAGDSVPALKARVSRLEEQMKTGVPARYVRAADEVPDEGVPDEDGPAPAEDAETRYSAPDGGEYNAEPQADEPAGLPDDETDDETHGPAGAETSRTESVSWTDVLNAAAPSLPPDSRLLMADERKVWAHFEGDVLRLEAEPGFVYGRLSRQPIIQKIAEAASGIAGREIRVLVSELRRTDGGVRSLDDLKQFKEVKFI